MECWAGGIGNNYPDLFDGRLPGGATIHTNSWGGPPQALCRAGGRPGSDSYLWGNKDMTVALRCGQLGSRHRPQPRPRRPPFAVGPGRFQGTSSPSAPSENNRPNVKSPVAGNKPLVYGRLAQQFPLRAHLGRQCG
ncbi:hypothetical protein J3459_018521 [Metarhizium acridum]|nr:hypothetical protein J3459_018521 [Metarhizium acridum]